MVENNKIEALTSADMIEYKGKLYTPMERLSLLMEEVKEGTKPNGITARRAMYV